MAEFAPGMRTIIRDEEWMIKKITTNSMGNKTLHYGSNRRGLKLLWETKQ